MEGLTIVHILGFVGGLLGGGFLIKVAQLIWKAAATVTRVETKLESVSNAVENDLPHQIRALDNRLDAHILIHHGEDPRSD
jgi:hypothetical protein